MPELTKLFRKGHPIITDPAEWIAAGHGMWGDPLERIPVEGRIKISHSNGKIVNEGYMQYVSRVDPVGFSTVYELTPTDDELVLDFMQENSEVGGLEGKLVAFDDRLVVSYVSGDGRLAGNEVFAKLGDNRYTVTGCLTQEGSIINLWKLDLVRPKGQNEAGASDGGIQSK